jgi:GNAT superfamily N-acetyltransferase
MDRPCLPAHPSSGAPQHEDLSHARSHQRRNVGSKLLAYLTSHLDRVAGDCYCIPYEHLVPFYGSAGFEIALASETPAFLVDRMHGYSAKSGSYTLMKRLKSERNFAEAHS